MPSVQTDIRPLDDAIARLSAKTPIGSALRTEGWARVPLALRERAFFTAAMEDVRVLATMQDKILKRVSMIKEQAAHGQANVDAGSFIGDLKKLMRAQGIAPGGGGLTDFTSAARLKLIYDFQTTSAAEYARWKIAAQDATALDNFPAQELLRVEDRIQQRDWATRWQLAGGQFYTGRMIALKDDPVWTAISRFGTPWPPFDFGSGMGVEDVSREDAEALGIIQPGQSVDPMLDDFNKNLEASVRGLQPEHIELLKAQFGDQLQIKADRAVWQGNLIGDLVDKITAGIQTKEWINLGQATKQALKKSRPHMDITGYRLDMRSDDIKHIFGRHGEGKEKSSDQRPVTKLDLEMVPHVWRDPDSIKPGHKPRSLEFSKKLNGTLVTAEYQKDPEQKVFWLNTMWAKKE